MQACAKLLFHGNNYMGKLRRGIAKEGSYLAGAKRFTCNCSIEFKNPSNFFVFYFTLEILDKTKLHPWKLHKVVLHPLEIPEPKPKNPLKFHMILSWSPLEISLAFSINSWPWKLHMLILLHSWKLNRPTPPPWLPLFSYLFFLE